MRTYKQITIRFLDQKLEVEVTIAVVYVEKN